MYGENGEVDGDPKNAFRPECEISDHDKHYYSGLPPEFWERHGISRANLLPLMAPLEEAIKRNTTSIQFFGH